ncbi:MAG: DUF4906 domain-containing protein [Bacteroidales bacterium]|nr:DUF4906 domain-containing protein [Bacteroidales bacterium]
MKTLNKSIILFLAAIFLACTEEQGREDSYVASADKVSFVLENETVQSKGNAVTADPTSIKEITLAAYSNGALADCRHFTGTSGLFLILNRSLDHTVLAIANMGDRSATMPSSLSDALKMKETLGWSSINSKGFPMAGVSSYAKGSSNARLTVKRLLAKVSLKIDTDWPGESSFKLKSITVGNTNSSVALFGSSKAGSKADLISGDYTATLSNPMVFYLPENLQGDLLPSNRDPYRKNLENLQASGKSDLAELCSYMDVVLTQEDTYGVSGDRRYRFYIGSDNTGNFDVERNTDYEISLRLTLDGFNIVDNWKVDNSDVSDSRSLAFRSRDYYAMPGVTAYVDVDYSVGGSIDDGYRFFNFRNGWSFYDTDASLSLGQPVLGRGIAVTAIENKVTVGDRIPIKVRTFDNAHDDIAYINISPDDVSSRWKEGIKPHYIAQKGTIEAEVPPGIDKLIFEVAEGCTDMLEIESGTEANSAIVSLIGAGDAKIAIAGLIGDRKVMLSEYEVEVLAPVLSATREDVVVPVTGGRATLLARYRSIDGALLSTASSNMENRFDNTLYDRLLRPVSSIRKEEAGLFLTSNNIGVYASSVNVAGKNILDYCGPEHSTVLTYTPVDSRIALQVEPATVICTIQDPFPEASEDRMFGFINNKYDCYVGSVDATALDVTDKAGATLVIRISDLSSNVSVSGDAPDMAYSYDNGRIRLERKNVSQYSAGKYKLYGRIYNTLAEEYSDYKTLGYFESYLFTGFVANAKEIINGYNISASFANRFGISYFQNMISSLTNSKIFIFHQGPTTYISPQYYVFDSADDINGNYIAPDSNDFYTWGSWCDVTAYNAAHMVTCNQTIYHHHVGLSDLTQWNETGEDFFSTYSPLISVDASLLVDVGTIRTKEVSRSKVLYSTRDVNMGEAGVPYHLVGLPASPGDLVSVPWNR